METRIKTYLEQRASEDELFAKSYAKKNKSIEECCEYIISQAKKQAVKGCAMIEDDVVFNWAVHYYDEDDIKIEKSSGVKATVSTSAPKRVEVPKAKLKVAKKEDVGQLSLF